MKTNLIERTLKTIRNYDMMAPGDVVLAAVSGGPDSVFLLHALIRLKSKFGIKEIVVANMDHGLRPKASRGDSIFVKELAAKSGLRLAHKRLSAGALKKRGFSTEELAREARYKFFDEAAAKAGANVIATGHTLDDQAETIMMRIIKGASLKGLVGISPVRGRKGLRVIRPLIEFEKNEILRYLHDERMTYCIDSTNSEPIYFRNAVRSEIMPFLEKYNPRFKRSLFNLAEHLRRILNLFHRKRITSGKVLRAAEKAGWR